MKTIPPRGSAGRFYAPSPSLGGRIVRFAFVGALVTAAAYVARARTRAALAAGVRTDTDQDREAWPWPSAEDDPDETVGTSHAAVSSIEASQRAQPAS